MLLAEYVWSYLEKHLPHYLGDVNPHNEEIIKIFGNQGGYWSSTESHNVLRTDEFCPLLMSNSQRSYLLRPGSGGEYCDRPVSLCRSLSVCMCVYLSVRKHISGTAGPIGTKFCVQIPCGRGSVLFWRRCATLCTSGFMDDVTFGHNGPYGVSWPAWSAASRQLRARPGRSLMSMNACLPVFNGHVFTRCLSFGIIEVMWLWGC